MAYEAATADIKDFNMIDSFHLEAYDETTVNYNRDVEVFPVLKRILEKIMGTECAINRRRIWALIVRVLALSTMPPCRHRRARKSFGAISAVKSEYMMGLVDKGNIRAGSIADG